MAKKEKETVKKKLNLSEALAQLNKEYGAGTISAGHAIVPCEVISTGAITLDNALGVGGVPKGRIIEISGPESGGKTTLALSICKMAQKNNGQVAFIDVEHALDTTWAANIGVDVDKLIISQPDSGEQAFDICESLILTGQVDLIVVDSVASMLTQAEIDGEITDSNIGAQARLMSKGLKKLVGILKKSNTCLVFINQIRMKIGVLFGSPETTPGGNALKFYSSVRIDIRKTSTEKSNDIAVANIVKAKINKNKVAPPFRTAEFRIAFGNEESNVFGVDEYHALIEAGITHDILEKQGSWISYGDTRIGNGFVAAQNFLRSNKDMAEEIRKKIIDINRTAVKSDVVVPISDVDEEGFEVEEEEKISE